jgi:signal transduction histidine kinase
MSGGAGSTEVGARGRQRILLLCAAAVLLFSPTDWLALVGFSSATLMVRLVWVAILVLTAFAQLRADARRTHTLLVFVAVASTLFYSALVQLTGGAASALFSWMLAVPIVVALVLQDNPAAIAGSGIALVVAGLGILVGFGSSSAIFAAQWAGEAVVMTWLALYVSATHRRMRAREESLRLAHDEAAARVRVSESAIAARDEFLAVASHELRTPLTSLLLHIEAIERGVFQKSASGRLPSERQRLDAVARQARRLASLIDGMLDVSRLTSGWLELELTDTDLSALVRDVAQRFAPDAAAAGCAITLRVDRPCVGTWDVARLDQIVTNLVGNALKYGAGAPVEIEAAGDETVVSLTVRDHGIGISKEDQQRIFQRFERAASERQYGGLGIGLWIASELAKALGGQISVASEPGEGAAFTLELPRRAVAATKGRVRRTPARANA